MQRMRKILISFCLLCYVSSVWAWNYTGHRVIGKIAYQQLTPAAKQRVDQLIPILGQYYSRDMDFSKAAIWPDLLKGHQVNAFNHWHYINIPIRHGNIKAPHPRHSDNVVWAIQQSEQVLSSPRSNDFEKALFLSFLIHFVGDIHQPMHCASLYSSQFPDGDRGGSLFTIKSPIADNLHQYWDSGLGLFLNTPQRYPSQAALIDGLVADITAAYPPADFADAISNVDPDSWAQESHQIAATNVYLIGKDTTPTKQYTEEGQVIAKQRAALAGYRLAAILNQTFR